MHAPLGVDSDGGAGHGSPSLSAAATPSSVASESIDQYIVAITLSHAQSFCCEFCVSFKSSSGDLCTLCVSNAEPFFESETKLRDFSASGGAPGGPPYQLGRGDGLASLAD